MNPFQYATIALGVLLAASVSLNAWQYHDHDKTVALAAAASQYATDAKAGADACSASVDALGKDGTARQGRLERLIAGVAPKVQQFQAESIAALTSKPDNPQDLCGSLARYFKIEIGKERTP